MSDIPRLKEDLVVLIDRQTKGSLSETAKNKIHSAITLYNAGEFRLSQRKIASLHRVKSATLQELRDKINSQINKGGLQ